MTTVTDASLEQLMLENGEAYDPALQRRRRVRGLRIKTLPSWPLLSQTLGGAAVLGGVFLLWGVAVTLIVGGVAAITLGTLREGGKI